MDVRVLFEGTLDKCTVEHGKKDWKRRYFVFKHILASNVRSLEFYAAGTKNWRKAEPKGVLALYPGYEVVKVHEPRRHFVFEIKTVDHTYRVAAHSEDELNQWILVLERESIVNSFCVEPEANEHMAKLGASDTCHLHVANNELRLLCAKDGRLLVAWPFTCLRRYMSAPCKFTVEAGRRAPTGEGKFAFLTPQYDEIYKLLDNVIKSRAGNKPSTTSSHAPLRKTKSVPADGGKDVSCNDYEQLMATGTSQGTCTEHQISSGSSNSMKNDYAAPYGHLPSRDAMKTASPIMGKRVTQTVPDNRLSVESEEGEQYNTLNHPLQDSEERQHSQKGIKEDEYSTLDQNLSPPHMHAILHHHGNSKPIATSQHQAMEDAYNVLGETLPHVVPSRDQSNEENTYNTLDTKPTSQSQVSMSAPQDDQMYNTLNQANPARSPRKPIQPPARTGQLVVKPPPKPLARNLSSDLVNKPHTSHSSSPDESEDMYNTLDTSTRPPPPPIRKMPDQGDDDTYNTLETSKPRHPPPSPVRKTSDQLKKLQKSKSFSVDKNNDVYNTLDTAKVGRHSPVPIEKMKKTFQASTDKGDEMYNVLDAAKRAGKSSMPAPRLTEQSLQSVDGDEMYNTLDSARVGAMSSPICNGRVNSALSSNLSRNDKMDDMYNTLDESRTGGSVSAPVPTQRSFLSHGSNAGSPVKKDSPALQRNSTSSLQSLHCPLDAPVTQLESQKSSSLDDLDSYASIDYATMSPPKGEHTPKQVPVPAQRPLKTKGLPPRVRKSSAPDIISLATTNSGKDVKKGGKSGFVSNLKASLEAGGLDFTKPRRKPKKLSREDSSGELPTHAEIEEDVFAPSTPPVKAGRSSSSPADPRQGEDIYDELDQSAPRPKSLQITKPKKVA